MNVGTESTRLGKQVPLRQSKAVIKLFALRVCFVPHSGLRVDACSGPVRACLVRRVGALIPSCGDYSER
jgi:hypothetical protein